MLVEQIKPTVEKATEAARIATEAFLAKHGDRDACGFAWVTVYEVKMSSKLGKAFKAAGFEKAYGGGIQLWNPSKSYTQSISAKEKGADAFVEVMREAFPQLKIYSNSRMD